MINSNELEPLGFVRKTNSGFGVSQAEFEIGIGDFGTRMILTELSNRHDLTIIDRFGAEVSLPSVPLETIDQLKGLFKALTGCELDKN